MAGVVEQQSGQQMVGFVAYDGAVGPLVVSDFCRTASNSARSMIAGCSPGRISSLYLTSPI